jgi:hypothetical protein
VIGVSRRRVSVWSAVVVLTVSTSLTVIGATAAYGRMRPPLEPEQDGIRCYSKATLAGGDHFYGKAVPFRPGADATPGLGRDAVAQCTPLWRLGELRRDVRRPAEPDGREHEVPTLDACELPDHRPAVFPGQSGTCRRLGLPSLPW